MHKFAIVLMSALLLNACATNVTYEINPDPCIIFDPIYGSSKDTERTKEQLENYMDTYTGICNEN